VKIASIKPRKILDSKGNWTIEVVITTANGITAYASVPSGTSCGKFEAVNLPANEAVLSIEDIFLEIAGKDFKNQLEFDNELISLDGTNNKSKLGANSILALSLAFCKAEAQVKKVPLYKHINEIGFFSGSLSLPKMMVLMFEGGKHGSGGMLFQEFMYIVENVDEGLMLYNKIKEHLEDEHLPTEVGLEGAFSPLELDNTKALKIMTRISPKTPIALDIAYSSSNNKDPGYEKIIKEANIFSLEDVYGEEDWENWEAFSKKYQIKLLIIGDDLITTNPTRLSKAIDKDCIGGVIIKPNQIGTVSETLTCINLAKSAGLATIVSHRSGETNDTFIADLAVGSEANFVKFGAPTRGERVCKYNRLLEIGGELFQSIL